MKYLWLVVLYALHCFAQVPAFTDADRKQKLVSVLPAVDAQFEKFFRERQIPGLVYGIVIDQELVHVKAFGVRDQATNDPVTPDTMFRIASMTKSFTALAILKLRDAGKLSLDDPASKYIPEMASTKYPTRDSAPITVRQLLTHSAGFPEDNPWGDRQLAIPDSQMSKWIDQGIPFSTPPDTSFEYSNYGFALLGRIVAKVSGQSYEQYLNKEILSPLGLSSSTLEPSNVPPGKAAVGYGRRDGKYFVIPSLAHGSFGAMGGLVTSARDMARYVSFHLAAEPPRDDSDSGPVRRSSVREMQRAWRTSSFSATRTDGSSELRASTSSYGYGLSVAKDCRFQRIVSHGGGLPGFGSFMMWLPEYGVGLFAMANLTYMGPSAPMREALEIMYRTGALKPRSLPPSPVLKSTQQTLTALWNDWSDVALNRIAADNLYLDVPREAFKASVTALKEKFTGCKPDGEIRPENWLRGEFQLACSQGKVNVSFTLAPTNPPKVQALQFAGIPLPAEAIVKAAQSGVKSTPYGQCTLQELLGSANDFANYRVNCANGEALMTVRSGSSGITTSFSKAPGQSCTP